jgi:CHAT domain-containing protein/Tfp pilus assembly protein PilF
MSHQILLCLSLGTSLTIFGLIAPTASGQTPAPATEDQEQPTIEHRRRIEKLGQQLVERWKANDLEDALSLGLEMLALERKVYGETHEAVAATLKTLATIYESLEDWERAQSALQEALQIQVNRFGEGHWRVTDAQLAIDDLALIARLRPPERGRLQIANRRLANVHQLRRNTQYQQAIPLAADAARTIAELFGEEHPRHAASLHDLAGLYTATGIYAPAEPLLRKALEIRKKVLGEGHPRYATTVEELAGLYISMENYAQAEPFQKESLEITRKVHGQNHPHYAQNLNGLAQVYRVMGDYPQAEALYREGLQIQKRIHGQWHCRYATSLTQLAELYESMGHYVQAEPLVTKALEIRKEVFGQGSPQYGSTLKDLAEVYVSMDDYAQAKPLATEALEIVNKTLGKDHPLHAQSLRVLGRVHQSMGDFTQAESLYRKASEFWKSYGGDEDRNYSICLNHLASVYGFMGQDAQAELVARKALEIVKKRYGEEHHAYASCLNNLALVYAEIGDYAKAELLFTKALKIRKGVLGQRDPGCATNLSNLASLYASMFDYAKAEPLYKEAVEIQERVLGPGSAYVRTLGGLAQLYLSKGDAAQAELVARKALNMAEKHLGEEHPDYASCLYDLGLIYEFTGDYSQAESLFRKAMEIEGKVFGEEHDVYAVMTDRLARLYQSMGNFTHAESLSRKAVEIRHRTLEMACTALGERQQLAMGKFSVWQLHHYITLTAEISHGPDHAYRHTLAWKGSVFARQRQLRLADEHPELAPQLAELQTVCSQLAALAFRPSDRIDRDYQRRRMAELTEQKELLESDLARASMDWRPARQHATPERLRAVLPKDSVLIDVLQYHYCPPTPTGGKRLHEDRLVAFVVRADRPVQRIELGPVEPIGRAVARWRASLGTSPDGHLAAAELRRLIWDPLTGAVAGASLVLISPDGPLSFFPLAALPGQRPDTYLIEDIAIAVVPVSQMFPSLLQDGLEPPQDEIPSSLLLVGGIDYGAATGPPLRPGGQTVAQATWRPRTAPRGAARLEFLPLPGTAEEMSMIDRLWRKSHPEVPLHVLQGTEPTEQTFGEQATKHRYLHVATHGFFAPEALKSALNRSHTHPEGFSSHAEDDPFGRGGVTGWHPGLLSGLALAGANRGPAASPMDDAPSDDGILTALELAGLNLRNTDLVVLSACETGLGAVAGGEGLLGLQRAFQVAGARTVIASLWQVDDAATRDLMTRFYENLWQKKLGKLEALRAAQLGILNNEPRSTLPRGPGKQLRDRPAATGQRAEPRLWAAWVLSGDPGPIATQ